MASALSSSVIHLPTPTKSSIISNKPLQSKVAFRRMRLTPLRSGSTPPGISDKVSESIEAAKEACEGDPESGECVAAWDEVEELSAAASHARDKKKDEDPLEVFCKDNMDTDECRTYED